MKSRLGRRVGAGHGDPEELDGTGACPRQGLLCQAGVWLDRANKGMTAHPDSVGQTSCPTLPSAESHQLPLVMATAAAGMCFT